MSGKAPGSEWVCVELRDVKVYSGISRPGLLCCAASKVYSGRFREVYSSSFVGWPEFVVAGFG